MPPRSPSYGPRANPGARIGCGANLRTLLRLQNEHQHHRHAGLLAATPAAVLMAQDSPESLLPPGFDDPAPAPAPAREPSASLGDDERAARLARAREKVAAAEAKRAAAEEALRLKRETST